MDTRWRRREGLDARQSACLLCLFISLILYPFAVLVAGHAKQPIRFKEGRIHSRHEDIAIAECPLTNGLFPVTVLRVSFTTLAYKGCWDCIA
ncbi:hypothetical protein T440DRAFT_191129 [Plenodomus tracheiphilus IPT5]|uniref:Uncharacterized protein n=1 Tax=Plenodomus tracheiphilus IPT5 TaxID=1408161 RepID=A0A6A7AVV7_9PLEO|nr:hypothetical protein T440DRAFT_191129 [Plenodomus tracheiphilus IPT5]